MVAQDRMPNNKIEAMCRAHGGASLVPPKRKVPWITYFAKGVSEILTTVQNP